MKISHKYLYAFISFATSAQAQVLMLDFGPTDPTGGSLTNSPYHSATPGFTDTTWNNVGTADVGSGLLYADGSAATGIALNLGASATSGTLNTISLTDQPSSSSALGTQTNGGVYTGSSVGKDGIFETTASGVGSVGLQITGLAAGTYDIYLIGRNTNQGDFSGSGEQDYTFYGAAGTTDANFDFSSYDSSNNVFTGSSDQVSSWTVDGNYVKLTVSLSAGQALNLAVSGAGSTAGTPNDQRGFLNSLQVVSIIPEPSHYALAFGAAMVALLFFRRRR